MDEMAIAALLVSTFYFLVNTTVFTTAVLFSVNKEEWLIIFQQSISMSFS